MTPQRKSPSSISIALSGSGGSGVMTAGDMLLEAAALAGCYGLMSRTSGPQIRGGEAAALLRLAREPIECHGDSFDILMAIDWVNTERFAAEIPLGAHSLMIGDPAQGSAPAEFANLGARPLALPMKDLAKKIPHGRANMVALGYIASLIGLPAAALAEAIRRSLGANSDAVTASLAAAEAGSAAAQGVECPFRLAPGGTERDKRWLITGNEAAGFGALKGGVRFVAAYPITPATEILEWMAPALTEVGGVLVQAEDELASINMAIGASYGGTPALTATSGPGLSLMVESLGLAISAEVPIVVVDVMRSGPSTGIPTKSEQSDLNIALYGPHGDTPHVVVAPNSVADCLMTTQWAVHLAEAMQVPALVLSDQSFGQTRMVIDRPADVAFAGQRKTANGEAQPYRRYALTESGISPMAIPGTPGLMHTADGLEHSERGTPSSQAKDHLAQLDKRKRKLDTADYGRHWAEVEGDGEGDVAIITWGSCTAPAREALALARADGVRAKLISLRLLSPAQPGRLDELLEGREARAGRRADPQRPIPPLSARGVFAPRRGAGALPARAVAAASVGDSPPTRPMEQPMSVSAETLPAAKDFKSDAKPVWCPGCGDYSVLTSLTRAFAQLAVRPENVAVVSGIGCSSRIPAYTNCYGFHGVHGRALAVATGLKVARPDLTVVAAGGDGDGYSIGGNHFLHACRRNVDLTYIVMDNHVYGMTKGQASPTTEPDWDNALAPGGTGVRPFNPLVIALASGANFVARAFSGDVVGTADIIAKAISSPGFSFVEVLSPCITFRPEQRGWKESVRPAPVVTTDDPGRAARRFMTDDGFNIGVLYHGNRKPYQPPIGQKRKTLSEIEREFAL